MTREVERSNRSRPAKLYAVGRRDIPPGLRVAQMVHALRLFQDLFPDLEEAWYRDSNTIVLLEVPDGGALEALAARARAQGVPLAEFAEPLPGVSGPTALALGPETHRLVSSLPLALRPTTAPPG